MDFEKMSKLPEYVYHVAGNEAPPAALISDAVVKWSHASPPPKIGAAVVVKVNGCGPAKVVGYYVQGGWLGVQVKLEDPPAWYVEQNNGNVIGCVFGAELA